MNQYEKWLNPIRGLFSSCIGQAEIDLFREFDDLLTSVAKRKECITLLEARKEIAAHGFALVDIDCEKGGRGFSSIAQGILQFIAGYHSLDYRDIAHVAHGRMIMQYGSVEQRDFWTNRLATGELIGIAATEEHSGSAIQGIRSHAVQTRPGRYVLNGRKQWISRVTEASAFAVFFRFGNNDRISAALLPIGTSGMEINIVKPSGLDGWSWGSVNLNDVSFSDDDFLGPPSGGLDIFRAHFEYYRPIVAITALGAASSVFDAVVQQLRLRLERGHIARCRDSALEQVGYHFHQLTSELLAAFYALSLNQQHHENARLWSRVAKAGAVAAAHKAVSDLALLQGASSFQHDHKISKTERDLKGLLLADGIHSELFRSAGQLFVGGFE